MSTIKIDQKRRSWGRTFGLVLLFLAIADQGISWMARDYFIQWTLNEEIRSKADWLRKKHEEGYSADPSLYCDTSKFLGIYPYEVCFKIYQNHVLDSEVYSNFAIGYKGPFPFLYPPFFPNFFPNSYLFQEGIRIKEYTNIFLKDSSIFRESENVGIHINEAFWIDHNGRRREINEQFKLEKVL